MLTEYWNDPNNNKNIPGWASIRTAAYQYNMAADPYQLVNLLADGNPSNDPDTAPLAQTLRAARECSGGACP